MIPYLPDGIYADLIATSNMRFQIQSELTRIQNRISRWFNIYFPEYKTVSGFFAEVGDITRFSSPKELQKLVGLALVENSSRKHKGQTTISRRGRKRLRYLLFEVAMSLAGKNPEFCALHHYYITRKVNPLKKMQSLMAVAVKLIRVFYVMLTKDVEYDSAKMLGDIKRPAIYI